MLKKIIVASVLSSVLGIMSFDANGMDRFSGWDLARSLNLSLNDSQVESAIKESDESSFRKAFEAFGGVDGFLTQVRNHKLVPPDYSASPLAICDYYNKVISKACEVALERFGNHDTHAIMCNAPFLNIVIQDALAQALADNARLFGLDMAENDNSNSLKNSVTDNVIDAKSAEIRSLFEKVKRSVGRFDARAVTGALQLPLDDQLVKLAISKSDENSFFKEFEPFRGIAGFLSQVRDHKLVPPSYDIDILGISDYYNDVIAKACEAADRFGNHDTHAIVCNAPFLNIVVKEAIAKALSDNAKLFGINTGNNDKSNVDNGSEGKYIAELQRVIGDTQKQLAKARQDKEIAESDLLKMKNERDELGKVVSKIQAELDQSRNEYVELHKVVVESQRQLAEAKAAQAKAEQGYNELRQLIENLQRSYAELLGRFGN